MASIERIRAGFRTALDGADPGLSRADRLCHACVDLLSVDGAAISLVVGGSTQGTFGSSSERSRRLDEYQFTFGEGPCLDSVREARPVLVADIQAPEEQRWPAFAGAVLDAGVRAVYALPVAISATYVGALDLFRESPGELVGSDLRGGLLAAQVATLPLLDLISPHAEWRNADGGSDGWSELATLERVEVYQATGMIMGRLGVGPAAALSRLRAHAFAHEMTASEVAWAIVGRRLTLDADDSRRDPPSERGPVL